MLAGCNESRVSQADYPTDYRLRHPITLKEGNKSLVVFRLSLDISYKRKNRKENFDFKMFYLVV